MPPKNIAKGKKKKWIPILGTQYFNKAEIGETLVEETSKLIGRNVAANLGTLTNDSKLQNIKVTFKIKEVKNEKAETEVVKYEVISTNLKRMIHKGKEKVDDSFELETKDNIKVKIKPFMITRSSAKKTILTSLRKKTREMLIDILKKTDYESLMENIIRYRTQNYLKRELKKIYPLAQFQIRVLQKLPSKNIKS